MQQPIVFQIMELVRYTNRAILIHSDDCSQDISYLYFLALELDDKRDYNHVPAGDKENFNRYLFTFAIPFLLNIYEMK